MQVLTSLGIDWHGVVTQMIGFLILIALVARFGLKPIFSMLDERQADIKATYDQLDADRKAMEQTRREYEARLAGIEDQARERIQAAVKEAQDLRASIIGEAQKQAETVVENGRADLERERARTFADLRREVADLAILAATRVIGDSMDGDRQRKLVDQFISQVGQAPAQYQAKPVSVNGTAAGNGTGVA